MVHLHLTHQNRLIVVAEKGVDRKPDSLQRKAEKAQEILHEMIKLHEESENDRVRPNTDSFNFVLRAWSRCRSDPFVAERVTGALKAMELYQRDSEGHVQANTLSYSIAIDAWSIAAGIKAKEYFRMQNQTYQPTDFSDGYDKVGNVEAIVQYMHELKNAGVHSASPYTVT